jgi:hypothetical protein
VSGFFHSVCDFGWLTVTFVVYHNSGDLSQRDGYDFDQLKSIAKVQFATVLHAAGYELPESAKAGLKA